MKSAASLSDRHAHALQLLEERFQSALPPAQHRALALRSGWEALDRIFGGLALGETLLINAAPGAGALGLASLWARAASASGEASLVVDVGGSTFPHAWVEPAGGAPIWVVAPTPADAWLAIDVALRSKGFGLVLAIDAPRPSPGPRISSLMTQSASRLVVIGEHAPVKRPRRLMLETQTTTWQHAPVGAAPRCRSLLLRCDPHPPEIVDAPCPFWPGRLRALARAPDRRTSRHSPRR